MPPIAWVFSGKRIDERVDWFDQELGRYTARRVLRCPAAQDLSTRYAAMLIALRRRYISGHGVEQIVGAFFPGDLYARMLTAANEGNRADQEMANDMLARGEWMGW